MADNYTLLFSDILNKVHKAKTKAQKVEILQKYDTQALRMLLKASFDPTKEWVIPEGEVPYKKNEAPINSGGHTRLVHEWRTLYNYVRGGNDKLSQMKRETMFIQLLEGLHESEAELLMLVKDKNLQSKYRITRALVEEVFDDIVWRDK